MTVPEYLFKRRRSTILFIGLSDAHKYDIIWTENRDIDVQRVGKVSPLECDTIAKVRMD